MAEAAKELPPPSPMRTIINLLPLLILTWYLCQNRPDQNPRYQLDQCGAHLHTLGVALEKDRLLSPDKLYNKELTSVLPEDKMPECPVGGKESYLEGYKVNGDRTAYTLVCKGEHHKAASVPSDYPRIAFSVQEASGEKDRDQQSKDTTEKDAKLEEVDNEPLSTPTPTKPEASPSPAAPTPNSK